MNNASTTSPPQELFRELTDLGNLIFSMLTGPQVVVRRWPSYYMVYLELDRLCREISRSTGYLSRGFVEADGTPDIDRIEGVNASLAQIDGCCRTLVDLLVRIERHGQVSYDKPALKDVVSSHFSAKSTWYPAFREYYRAGRVSDDGQVLERAVLPIDPHPAIGPACSEQKRPVERQTFELISAQSRTLLGRTGRNVQTTLNQVYAALGAFFIDRCPSTSELLHPWMN